MRPRTQRLQFVLGPPLSQVPISGQSEVVGETAGRTVSVRVFSCRLHTAGRTGRAGPPEQTPDLRSVVSGYRRYLAVDSGRPETPGGADRLFLYPALVATDPQFPSPPALCCARRGNLS